MAINLWFLYRTGFRWYFVFSVIRITFITNAVGADSCQDILCKIFRKRHKILSEENERKKTIVKETTEKERSPYRDSPFWYIVCYKAIFSVCFFQFFNTIPIFYKEVAHLDQKKYRLHPGITADLLLLYWKCWL